MSIELSRCMFKPLKKLTSTLIRTKKNKLKIKIKALKNLNNYNHKSNNYNNNQLKTRLNSTINYKKNSNPNMPPPFNSLSNLFSPTNFSLDLDLLKLMNSKSLFIFLYYNILKSLLFLLNYYIFLNCYEGYFTLFLNLSLIYVKLFK